MILLPLLVSLTHAAIKGTLFESCPNGNDLCFKIRLEKLTVEVGNVGTDDNVQIEICSDVDREDCCLSPSLHSSWTDDWTPNKTEEWDQSFLGKCQDREFLISDGPTVSIIKEGRGDLRIESIDVESVNENCWKVFGFKLSCEFRSSETFHCGSFQLGTFTHPTRRIQTNTCHTKGYQYQSINQVIATMGEDGTDDDVEVEICSDVNNVCCSELFDQAASDDWSGSDREVWKNSDIGDCALSLKYKIRNGPKMSLKKNGRDDLTVKNIEIKTDHRGVQKSYDCGGLELIGECDEEKCLKTARCRRKEVSKDEPIKDVTLKPDKMEAIKHDADAD